jgi:hypothetical protein
VKSGEARIDSLGFIEVLSREKDRNSEFAKNLLPTGDDAVAHRALMQLHQLRDYYRQGWVPDWENLAQDKYCIVAIGERQCKTIKCTRAKHFLSFQSQELAGKFLQCFIHEIYQARELL